MQTTFPIQLFSTSAQFQHLHLQKFYKPLKSSRRKKQNFYMLPTTPHVNFADKIQVAPFHVDSETLIHMSQEKAYQLGQKLRNVVTKSHIFSKIHNFCTTISTALQEHLAQAQRRLLSSSMTNVQIQEQKNYFSLALQAIKRAFVGLSSSFNQIVSSVCGRIVALFA